MTAQPPAKFALTLPINAGLQTTNKVFQYPFVCFSFSGTRPRKHLQPHA